MAHKIDIDRAQHIIDYTFRDSSWLSEALRSPEKRHDPDTKMVIYENDGNRALAQLGRKVIDAILIDRWFTAGSGRGNTQEATNMLTSNENLAQIARRTGLDNCVRLCERQGDGTLPTQTMKLATTAVVGAVWIDSDRDFRYTVRVLEKLGILDTET